MDRILSTYPPDRSASAQRQLEHLGVEVRTSTRVTHVDEDGVRFTGPDGTEESIAARTVFWTAGVLTAQFARTVAAATGASTDRAGRVIVEPDLTIPGHPEIFVVGDAALEPWKRDKPTPGVAQGAMQGGAYAAKVIRRRVLGRPYEPFRYSDHGDVAVIGRAAGVTNISWLGPVRAAGRIPCLGAVARHPHLLPDRVLEPDRRPGPLGMDVPDPRSRRPADHGQGIAAADRGTRAAGPRADGARRRGIRRRRAWRARPGLGEGPRPRGSVEDHDLAQAVAGAQAIEGALECRRARGGGR